MLDQWRLQDFAPGEGQSAGAFEESFVDATWIPVDVPGDVHTTLVAAGRISDPFFDRNEIECAWVEDREWWYRLHFKGSVTPLGAGERIQLVFHGLDTFATIWLNGVQLGVTRNMFREAVYDVTQAIRAGRDNTLAICFDRPLDHCGDVQQAPESAWMPPRVAMRKAQFGYGWDWGPRLPTVGIWRAVELRRQHFAALIDVRFATLHASADEALVMVTVEVEHFAGDGPFSASVSLRTPGETSEAPEAAAAVIPLRESGSLLHGTAYLRIERPRLWWTHDLGDPALYLLQIQLASGHDVLDSESLEVGIRTLTLDQAPDQDEPGTRFFRFVLNGVPLFSRGTDWIPADSFVGAIKPARYTKLLTLARDGNHNMLRVWGGGIYEHDIFYDECDRLGLLVWQDFMFACAAYPEDDEMATEVDAEARYQVRRLRNHASLALWCGNNENQWIYANMHWQDPGVRIPGHRFYSEILPAAVAELDGQTPYWPGSPYGGNDHNSAEEGDRHNWQVWHGGQPRRFGEEPTSDHTPQGVSYVHYAEDMGRFISEFGMHAAPVFETLRRNMPSDQLFHHSASMDHHNKDNPKNKGDNLMEATTGVPTNLEEYVDFSMIAQAEGLKFGLEHYRRRFPHCAGALVWQLNDCWPVLSWSVVDYYGFGKAGYFYLRRAYAPVLASFKIDDDGSTELWVTNNGLEPVVDTASVQLARFTGSAIWTEDVQVRVPACTSMPVQRWTEDKIQGSAERFIAVRSQAGQFPGNRAFFCAIKDLQLPRAQVEVAVSARDAHTLEVRLAADSFAYFANLTLPLEDTAYSDNYFDLIPGEERRIVVSNSVQEIAPALLQVHWR